MVYVFLAEGFEEIEALTPVDWLRRVDITVTTIGLGGKQVKGAHGIVITADLEEGTELDFSDITAVVLPGGMPGAEHLNHSVLVDRCLQQAEKQGAVIAAICAAPMVLGHKGLLKEKKATCFPGFEGELFGAKHTGKKVEKDGRIITAKGPGAALDFALTLVKELKGEDAACALRESLQCE